jgi:hypothetical protein
VWSYLQYTVEQLNQTCTVRHEENHHVLCGSRRCPHPSLEELEAIFTSFPTVEVDQRYDLLTRYVGRPPEYDTPILDTRCSGLWRKYAG